MSGLIRIPMLAAAALAALTVACQPAAPAVSRPPAPTPAATPAPAMLTAAQIGVADPGLEVSLWGDPAGISGQLQLAQEAGAVWIKQRFEWRNIEPTARGRFVWAESDRIVDAVNASGLKLIVRLDSQPAWSSSRVSFPTNGPPDDPRDFANFVGALATRYAGRIQAYEVWDQPNLATHWGDRRPDPGEYTHLLRAAYSAIKAADPGGLVVSAALAPTTRYDETSVPDLIYLRSMYGANAKGAFDVLGMNAPGFKAPPCMDPQQVAEDPSLTNDDQTLPVEGRRIYAFRHIEDVRGIMSDRGDGNKPIGVLAMGWSANISQESPDVWHAVSPDTAATYRADAFSCARADWSPWIGFMTLSTSELSQ